MMRAVGQTVKWLLILGALLIVAIVVAVIVSLGTAADESEQSSAEVSQQEFQRVRAGMSKPEVRALLGADPESTDETSVEGFTLECWYYGILASGGTYQFCFDNGRLSSKSRT